MRIYTRSGDAGQTSLADGARVSKAAQRVSAYGDVDELNAVIGVLRAEDLGDRLDQELARVQECLFEIGAFLADPRNRFHMIRAKEEPGVLEKWIDDMESDLPKLSSFVLPAGCRSAALAHQARTVCRRAERQVVIFGESGGDVAIIVPLLNRLSDTFFVLARWLNQREGVEEVTWHAGN